MKNELRIGNYVNVSNELQSPFRIDGFEFLHKDDCKIFKENGTYNMPPFGEIPNHPLTWYLKDCKPIPLTEEWLLKFGFEKHIGWDDMEFWYLPKDENNAERFELYETILGFEAPSGKKVKEVHTLQNCYFFHELSGEELTLKTT